MHAGLSGEVSWLQIGTGQLVRDICDRLHIPSSAQLSSGDGETDTCMQPDHLYVYVLCCVYVHLVRVCIIQYV